MGEKGIAWLTARSRPVPPCHSGLLRPWRPYTLRLAAGWLMLAHAGPSLAGSRFNTTSISSKALLSHPQTTHDRPTNSVPSSGQKSLSPVPPPRPLSSFIWGCNLGCHLSEFHPYKSITQTVRTRLSHVGRVIAQESLKPESSLPK